MSPSHISAMAYNLGTVWFEDVKGEMQIHGIYYDYLGYRIDKQGLQLMPDKLVAITGALEPKHVQQLKAFLELDKYYRKFIKNLSITAYWVRGPLVLGNTG